MTLAAVEAEMERQFDVCHTCRRCFNLCDSFPRLFDLIDEAPTGELDSVPKADYAKVDEACTLCDMCFLTKCPYVPPHEFDIDIPHLILRYRAGQAAGGPKGLHPRPAGADRPQRQAGQAGGGPGHWATARANTPLRKLLDAIAQIDAEAELPKYHAKTATDLLKAPVPANPQGPAFGLRKAVIYATCFRGTTNQPDTAVAAARVLALQGVETVAIYPECCGMPQLEAGDLKDVAGRAERISAALRALDRPGL